jgi:hypothetical protein
MARIRQSVSLLEAYISPQQHVSHPNPPVPDLFDGKKLVCVSKLGLELEETEDMRQRRRSTAYFTILCILLVFIFLNKNGVLDCS